MIGHLQGILRRKQNPPGRGGLPRRRLISSLFPFPLFPSRRGGPAGRAVHPHPSHRRRPVSSLQDRGREGTSSSSSSRVRASAPRWPWPSFRPSARTNSAEAVRTSDVGPHSPRPGHRKKTALRLAWSGRQAGEEGEPAQGQGRPGDEDLVRRCQPGLPKEGDRAGGRGHRAAHKDKEGRLRKLLRECLNKLASCEAMNRARVLNPVRDQGGPPFRGRASARAGFDEYIGQETIKANPQDLHRGGQRTQRGTSTTSCSTDRRVLGRPAWAYLLAKELGVGIKPTSGPVIERAGDLSAILSNLQSKEVLFIDEIHRCSPRSRRSSHAQ